MFSGFDYVTVDPYRRRVYAAHTGSQALLIVDADSSKVVAQVRVGPLHGVAVDPRSGHVFTGDGDARSVSEIDPVAAKVLRSVDVPGSIDAIAFDPATRRIYADEDDGTQIFVIDSVTFTQTATIKLPGHKPEYLAVDPETSDLYQNISDLGEFVVVDGKRLEVKKTVDTSELGANHPLQYHRGRRHQRSARNVRRAGAQARLSGDSGASRPVRPRSQRPHRGLCRRGCANLREDRP